MNLKKIKIAFVIDKINIGGTEKQLIKTIELLDNDKFRPILICLRPSEYYYKIVVPCEKYVLHVYSLLSISGFLKLLWLAYYFRKHKIDIVQNFFFDANVFGILAAKLARVKKIISCRRDMGFWYTPKILRILKITNRFTNRFLVNSDEVKNHICNYESIQRCKVDVIYNGIDTESYSAGLDRLLLKHELSVENIDYVVGIVSNLNRPVKRLDIFLKAASEVLKNLKNVSFLIVGDGHLKSELKRLSEDLKIDKKVTFVGLVEDISPYISIFDVAVLCSDSEGFSNSILEYMASGVPIVATDAGGNKEAIEEDMNGFLVTPGDYRSISNKICILLNDREKRLEMANNGKLLVKRGYNWDKKIKEIETYYNNLLKYDKKNR